MVSSNSLLPPCPLRCRSGGSLPAAAILLVLALVVMPLASAAPRTEYRRAEPLASQQWYLNWNERGIRPWDGTGVAVGIIDTGIDATHPELAAAYNTEDSRSFLPDQACGLDPGCADPGVDPLGHGTGVAGIIAAARDGRGIDGAAPGVDLVSLKAGDATGSFFAEAVSQAIRYGADAELDILVMAFTTDPWFRYCAEAPGDTAEERAQQAADLEKIESALNYAADHGIILIAAAGNEGFDLDHGTVDWYSSGWSGQGTREVNEGCVTMPAQSDAVITVGAVNTMGERASYSNIGQAVDIVAPGGEMLWYDEDETLHGQDTAILTTVPESLLREANVIADDGSSTSPEVIAGCDQRTDTCRYYWYVCGTSYAAPQVAAAAAILISRGTPAYRVGNKLKAMASPIGCPAQEDKLVCQDRATGGNTWYGSGTLRLGRYGRW
ncbi:Peptidase families S8 and S53 [Actinomyces succiniciruminis]|uniref:Peptidase families S8 and S53 n=2 Tax=Actinomyces succiniciruminis TaxID=1522002 RepID=A0A1L7R8H5_9ACTO|nr:Peptidase families S8 and S53 [Actinomyces succiniciruminis]